MSVPPGSAEVLSPEEAPQEQPQEKPPTQGVVFRNTVVLLVAQVLGMPLSIALNAAMARYLGPSDFGYIYLAGTFASFAFLVVDWGQSGTLPSLVARDRSRAAELLGSGIAWRAMSSVVIYFVLAGLCQLLGYGPDFQVALGLVCLARSVGTMTSGCLDTARGFENTKLTAYSMMGYQFLVAALVIPALFLGGGLRATLGLQAVADVVILFFVWRAFSAMQVGALAVRRETMKELLQQGTPFLSLAVIMALQPNVDALMLSKLATPEAIGWHAAARKLVGVLVFPASALASALYPTLCRLYAEDAGAFRQSVSGALRTATILVMPLTLGCALYADVAILIFSKESFGPAEDNLRVLSLFIFLLYFSMTLGSAIAAAGAQRSWAVTQFGCVILSAVADPILVPWFHARVGNGGLGVCWSTVLSELLMVVVGFRLAPRGMLDRTLGRGMVLAVLAGAVMAGVSWVLRGQGLTPFLSAPIAGLAYLGCLWLTGGIDAEQVEMVRSMIKRKTSRA